MKVVLVANKNNVIHSYTFNNISDAYHFYAERLATFGDRWRCFWYTFEFLNKVHHESTMLDIFRTLLAGKAYLIFDN